MRRVLSVTLLLAAGVLPAAAATVIVTPALKPPFGGALQCHVVNGDAAKPLKYVRQIVGYDGDVVYNPAGIEFNLPPLQSSYGETDEPKALFCTVTVTGGNKKMVRVTLVSVSGSGDVVAVVSAP